MTNLPPSLGAMIEQSAVRFGDRLAVIDGPVRLSYTDLAAQVRTLSRALMAVGVKPGDRVAIWLPNTYYWMVAALAAQRAGAALVPLNTRFSGREAADIVLRSGARVLFVADEFLGTDYLELLLGSSGGPGHISVAAEIPTLSLAVRVPLAGTAFTESETVIGWESLVQRAESVTDEQSAARLRTVGAEDVADIIFTSGTTGKPKGAMSSHRQTLAVAAAWAERAEVGEGDVFMIIAPFFHTFGYKAGWVVSFLSGATVLPQLTFDVDSAIATIERERVSILPGPPTIFQMLLAHPDRDAHDLSSLRVAVTGSAAVPVSLVERMREELTFRVILTAYGLTEAVVVTMCRSTDTPETISTTSGCAASDFAIRIADPGNRALPPGEDGEIQLTGPNLMLGYLDDAAATAATYTSDGWFRTGDIGHMNGDGYVTITDRLKDMFTVGGFNVYPAEVENILAAHRGIADSAVVSKPDERLGEVGVAYVVRSPTGATLTADDVISYCRGQLANFKVPRAIVFVDQLPRNASGKVLKRDLREALRLPSA